MSWWVIVAKSPIIGRLFKKLEMNMRVSSGPWRVAHLLHHGFMVSLSNDSMHVAPCSTLGFENPTRLAHRYETETDQTTP